MDWQLVKKNTKNKSATTIEEIVAILLANRGIKDEKEFFNPRHPKSLSLKELAISQLQVKKATARINKAITDKESIVVYGDYDADGVCATAVLWEALYELGANALPHIPERFSEGYGLNAATVKELKAKSPNLKLIVTVDNGIVATKAVESANELGVDVIITDHHQKEKKLPEAYAIVHTDKIGGAAVAWILARELGIQGGLDLAGIGTIADILPLVGANRSFAKFGLENINKSRRPGLLALLKEASVTAGEVGTYHIGFLVAPRINAMGRLAHSLDSLRLLCTPVESRAQELAKLLNRTNGKRQKIVEEVVNHARQAAKKSKTDGIVLLANEQYHEGVIGLAAAKLVEEHWRPAIVISKGDEISKASARSIPGFNIIEAIRQFSDLIEEGGGHPMAAGFSIKTANITKFQKKLNAFAKTLLTDKILTRKLKIDLAIGFKSLNWSLEKSLEKFAPTGLGNPTPTFATFGTEIIEARGVGSQNTHLKLALKNEDRVFEAIAFGFGNLAQKLSAGNKIDIAYSLEANVWNGNKSLQLKIKDINL